MNANDEAAKTALTQVGEFGLIKRLVALAPFIPSRDIIGPGDDCAAIPSRFLGLERDGSFLLITADAMVEGRHFSLDYSSFYDVGWKSLAVNLSDIGAMGGTPYGAVITLQLRQTLAVEELEELYRGMSDLAALHGVLLLGGDIVAAKEFSLSITVIGACKKPPICRGGAKAGDDVWVSGAIGGAGAALALLGGGLRQSALADAGNDILRRHRRPQPRIRLGEELLSRGLANSMIDVSDGLLQDAGHIAEQSRLQIILSLAEIPYHSGICEAGWTELQAITSGDDYELLLTAPESARRSLELLSGSTSQGLKLPPLCRIGVCQNNTNAEGADKVMLINRNGEIKSGAEMLKAAGVAASGYQHF